MRKRKTLAIFAQSAPRKNLDREGNQFDWPIVSIIVDWILITFQTKWRFREKHVDFCNESSNLIRKVYSK